MKITVNRRFIAPAKNNIVIVWYALVLQTRPIASESTFDCFYGYESHKWIGDIAKLSKLIWRCTYRFAILVDQSLGNISSKLFRDIATHDWISTEANCRVSSNQLGVDGCWMRWASFEENVKQWWNTFFFCFPFLRAHTFPTVSSALRQKTTLPQHCATHYATIPIPACWEQSTKA